MYKNKIYLAGPFFSDLQIKRIRQVKELLSKNNTIDTDHIFLPMEQDSDAQFEFGTLSWQQQTFNTDVRHIHQADCVVAVLDYEHSKNGTPLPDSGTIFEIGVAYQANIPVILVHFEEVDTINLMLAQSYTRFFNGEENVQQLANYDFNKLVHFQENLSVI